METQVNEVQSEEHNHKYQRRAPAWYVVKVEGFEERRDKTLDNWTLVLLVPGTYRGQIRTISKNYAMAKGRQLPMKVTIKILSDSLLGQIRDRKVVEL